MDLQTIKRLVRDGETETIEFKRKVRHPEKIVRELVAFANSKGGHLFIGVDDDLSIPGVKFPEEELYEMERAIQNLCRPSLDYKASITPLSDRHGIVVLEIPPSLKKPHYARETKEQRWGKAYVRVADKSLQASKELCRVMRGEKSATNNGFVYGDHEKSLMNLLGENEYVTLKQYAKHTGLSPHQASDILVRMTLNNVLRIIPREQGDWFEFVEH